RAARPPRADAAAAARTLLLRAGPAARAARLGARVAPAGRAGRDDRRARDRRSDSAVLGDDGGLDRRLVVRAALPGARDPVPADGRGRGDPRRGAGAPGLDRVPRAGPPGPRRGPALRGALSA